MSSAARRPAPPAVRDLPEQFFTGILAAAAHARAQPGPPLVDLGRGNPDLPPPAAAIRALQEAAGEVATPAVHGYPPFQGSVALREAIAARYLADHGVALDPETEVAVVPGTKTAIAMAVLACARGGDAVLLPDPGYPDYLSAVALAGARHVQLALERDAGWQPDLAAAPDDAALLVLNYPSNPTGVAAAQRTFTDAVAWAHRGGGWLLHDLAYGFAGFDGLRHRSVLEEPGARDVAVELWSASKVHGMAGWRIGFVVGNAELVGRIKALVDHVTAGVWTGIQRGLLAVLADGRADADARRDVYEARRDRLVAALRGAGADITAPAGTFYAWWELPEGLTAAGLLADHRVATAPGEGFGARGAGHVRLSLAVPDAELDEGARRLAAAVAAL